MKCYNKRTNIKHSYEFVFDFFKNEGYILLSKDYKNKEQKLEVVCPMGHTYKVSFGKFKNDGNRCVTCSGLKSPSYEEVRSYFAQYGYQLISEVYKNKEEKLKTICPFGHEWEVTFGKFKNGKRRCLICSGQKQFTVDEVRCYFNKYGYVLIDGDYKNKEEKLAVLCPQNHPWSVSYGKFKNRGDRCPICQNNGTSKPEIELSDLVKSLYPESHKLRHTKIKIEGKPHIGRFEVDIFVPKLNKGIEFDGKYYHSFNGLKRSRKNWPDEDIHNYHQIKDDYFKSKGINLIHIKEEDWMKDKQKCIDRCLEFLKS